MMTVKTALASVILLLTCLTAAIVTILVTEQLAVMLKHLFVSTSDSAVNFIAANWAIILVVYAAVSLKRFFLTVMFAQN